MDYGFIHDGRVYTPNATPTIAPEHNADRNAAIERAELAAWDAKPDRMLAYFKFPNDDPSNAHRRFWRDAFYPTLTGAHVTTWPGTRIGTITAARVYRHNFGGRFVAITVKGTNGATYHGRASWDNGSCVILRRSTRR